MEQFLRDSSNHLRPWVKTGAYKKQGSCGSLTSLTGCLGARVAEMF